jgi:glycosyltransferase involved in cell wall biosynthesis
MTTRGAVVIAAHNEAQVIARCLDPLHSLVVSGQLQVVVVCNGCSDDTARIARMHAGVQVLELNEASKAAALRAGDRVSVGPRIYLDADVVMTADAVLAVLGVLEGGGALAARPPILFDSTAARWPVQQWYTIRERLPSIQNVLWGAGTYALSVAGRARFVEFPDIVSDDLFIDSLFSSAETTIVPTDPVVVHTPRTSGDLLRILVRTYRTQDDVLRKGRAPVSAGQRGQLRDIRSLLRRQPRLAGAVLVYMALISAARIWARFKPAHSSWERDNSSRQSSPA